MSRLFTCVHIALRRSLTALVLASALIPASALAVSSATEADQVPTAHPLEAAPAPAAPAEQEAEPARPAGATSRSVRPTAPSGSVAEPAHAEPAPAEPAPAAAPAAEAPAAEAAAPAVPFATVGGQPLVLPEVVNGVGFHESSDLRALALEPIGTPTSNLNASRVTLPPGSADNEYFVLPTRGRANEAMTAVDIAVDHGVPVTSAVTGTVEEAGDYRLYRRTHDEMVVLVPDDHPHLRVRVLHLEGLRVAPGDRVEAGVTVLAASSRQLPFRSQIDRYTGDGPHVHIEVRPHDPEAEADEAPPEG